jgi:hypothetical protein
MASESDPTPSSADDLFLVPPGKFVAARNQLAAALKKAGQKSEAEAVKALAKPPVSVWGINHVARHGRDVMAAFLEASDRVRRAQIAGAATPEARQEYQASAARQRDALQPLLALIERALAEEGLNAGKPMLDKVANNLRWGAIDEQIRPLLAEGRLQDDVAPTDFSALVGHIPLVDRPRPTAPVVPSPPVGRLVGAIGPGDRQPVRVPDRTATNSPPPEPGERTRARQQAEGVRSELKAARTLAQRARTTLVTRRTANDHAQDNLERQRQALEQATRAADEAAAALEEAERIAREQEEQVDRLSASLAQLESKFA